MVYVFLGISHAATCVVFIDISYIIGISVCIVFVSFSLGVIVTVIIGRLCRKNSKPSSDDTSNPEAVNLDQKNDAINLNINSAYGKHGNKS